MYAVKQADKQDPLLAATIKARARHQDRLADAIGLASRNLPPRAGAPGLRRADLPRARHLARLSTEPARRHRRATRDGHAAVSRTRLDLAEALAKTSPQRPPTPRARPDTLGEPIAARSERLGAKKVPPTRSGPPQLTLRRGHTRARKL